MNALLKLEKRQKKAGTLLSIGLDPDMQLMPKKYAVLKEPLFSFCRMIVDNTAEFAAAFKPNSAFFEGFGAEGVRELKKVSDYIHKTYPEIPLIIDAKRGDISSTNRGYVKFVFDYLGADGVTLHPYLGFEALEPFLERIDKLSIILCRTSNPGAGQFQELTLRSGGIRIPLYEAVAREVVHHWNKNGNCMLVVGATYPTQLTRVREVVGDLNILVPGVGAQGGDIGKVVKAGLNSQKRGLLINVGRAILYKGSAREVSGAAKRFRDEINDYL
jgi:orotidine-5'-phosphate decarboxylase